jgi:hypothetical protein
MASYLPSVSEILGPLSGASFLHSYHKKTPIYLPLTSILTFLKEFNRTKLYGIITYRALGRRDLRVVRAGTTDTDRSIFSSSGEVIPTATLAAYADGCTVVVNNLQKYSSLIARIVRTFELSICQPIGANVYLTPPNTYGLAPHSDDHDVIVLQLEGCKNWEVFAPHSTLPLRGQHVDVKAHELAGPETSLCLQPGDALYIPRGYIHCAQTNDTHSMHLTLGISSYRKLDLYRTAIEIAANEQEWLREDSLRMDGNHEVDSEEEGWKALDMQHYLSKAHDALQLEFIRTLHPLDEYHLSFFDQPESISLASRLRLRVGTVSCVTEVDEYVTIHFPGNTVLCPHKARDALQYILDHVFFQVSDLPDTLDASAKLILVTKLITAGLLVPDESDDV